MGPMRKKAKTEKTESKVKTSEKAPNQRIARKTLMNMSINCHMSSVTTPPCWMRVKTKGMRIVEEKSPIATDAALDPSDPCASECDSCESECDPCVSECAPCSPD